MCEKTIDTGQLLIEISKATAKWHEYLNTASKDLGEIRKQFYNAVERFCQKAGITNVAFVCVNKHKGTIDLIQQNVQNTIKRKKELLEELPFVKYPDSSQIEGREEKNSVEQIDKLFGTQRNNMLISETEFFKQLFIEKNNKKESIGKYCAVQIDKEIINTWKTIVGCKSVEEFFQKNSIVNSNAIESQYNDAFGKVENEKTNLQLNEKQINNLLKLHKSTEFPIIPYAFLADKYPDKQFYHLVIPIHSSDLYKYRVQGDNGRPESNISVILVATSVTDVLSDKDKKTQYISEIRAFFQAVVSPLLDKYFYGYMMHAGLSRSAIQAIMLRNLSHNYGSHVLNRLVIPDFSTLSDLHNEDINTVIKVPLEETLKCLNGLSRVNDTEEIKKLKGQIEHLYGSLKGFVVPDAKAFKALGDIPYKGKAKFDDTSEEKKTQEFYKQISYLVAHIKCRMDYLCDISFGPPLLCTSRFVCNDVFKEFDRVRLLLNHISGLEDQFHYNIKIIGKDNTELVDDNGEITGKDFPIAIPDDVVGTQAIYNIIEDVIRNTAKHSNNTNTGGTITFTIRFSDISGNDDAKLKELASEYYAVEIFDNVKRSKEDADGLVKKMNNLLNDDVIVDGAPRTFGMGIIEMEAAAAYLRKLDVFTIQEELYHVEDDEKPYNKYGKLNLLKAIKVRGENENEYHFGYRFFVLRPQEVLLVLPENKYKEISDYPDFGIKKIGSKVFKTRLEAGCVFNYEFVVWANENDSDLIKKHATALSPRIIQFSEDFKNKKPDEIIKLCWEKWEALNDRKWERKNFNPTFQSKNKGQLAVYQHHECDVNPECEYVEVLSSEAKSKLPDIGSKDLPEYCVDIDDFPLTKLKNIESVNTKVLVIDERIQDAANTYTYSGKPFSYFYQMMGVEVPKNDSINLQSFNIMQDADQSSLADRIIAYINENIKDRDFVLIHYGILERVFQTKSENDDWRTDLNRYLMDLSKDVNVVIDSGRGVPASLPECVRFVTYSSVSRSLIELKSKYVFCNLLFSSRKTNRV